MADTDELPQTPADEHPLEGGQGPDVDDVQEQAEPAPSDTDDAG